MQDIVGASLSKYKVCMCGKCSCCAVSDVFTMIDRYSQSVDTLSVTRSYRLFNHVIRNSGKSVCSCVVEPEVRQEYHYPPHRDVPLVTWRRHCAYQNHGRPKFELGLSRSSIGSAVH